MGIHFEIEGSATGSRNGPTMSGEFVGSNSSTQISRSLLGVSRDDRVGGVREKIIKEEMGGKRKKENNSTGINTRVRGVCWLAGTARNHRGLHSLAKKSGAHTAGLSTVLGSVARELVQITYSSREMTAGNSAGTTTTTTKRCPRVPCRPPPRPPFVHTYRFSGRRTTTQ